MRSDRGTDVDTRVRCVDCKHLSAGYCHKPVLAGLIHRGGRAEVGPELAKLMQHCQAFALRSARTTG
jgi:hypothetical protein